MTAMEFIQLHFPNKNQEWYDDFFEQVKKIAATTTSSFENIVLNAAKIEKEGLSSEFSIKRIEKLAQTPTNMEKDKCPLNNTELVEKVQEWVSKLCKTGGRAWILRIPVDLKHDPDVVISELIDRYKEALSLLEKAAGLVGNPATGISGSTDLAADAWQEEHSKFIEKYGN